MDHKSDRVAAARAVIQKMLDKHKRLNFKMLEPEIRAIIGDPGASYDDVVSFFAECGLVVKLGSVHQFCIPRNIRPTLRAGSPALGNGAIQILRRRPRS